MGVTGLWKLIESSGKPVPLETLENKVLAIDISIWLHQVVKGYQDNKGGTLPNAHLLGLFNRVCKLLYFRIKPVFVFDGGVPQLKLQTIAKRAQSKSKIQNDAERLEQLLLETLAKEKIVKQALGDPEKLLISPPKLAKPKPTRTEERDEMFVLPPLEDSKVKKESATELDEDEDEELCPKRAYDVNINRIDVTSAHFKSLPADIRHDILTDIKETRKQNTWGRLRELPVESNDFSNYQMSRLLRRRQVQVGLEEAEKEMGGKTFSLTELESLLSEDGVLEVSDKCAQKIASDENTRFLLVRDIAKAMKEAKTEPSTSEPKPSTSKTEHQEVIEDDDEDLELQRAIQLSLGNDPGDPQPEVPSDGRVKMNPEQRQKFSGTIKTHGLIRGFMMEYAEMNDDDIQELVDATQVEDVGGLNDSFKEKFPNTDDYVLYGTPKKKSLSQEEKVPRIEEKVSGDVEMESDEVGVISDSESDEDAPQKSEYQPGSKIESNDSKNTSLVIEVVPDEFKPEDDLFADVFEEKKSDEIPDVEVASISSDDDTVEYEIPKEDFDDICKETESGFVSEVHEKSAEEEETVEEAEEVSENDKFWSILNEPVKIVEASEAEIRDSPVKELSENERFWEEIAVVKPKLDEKGENLSKINLPVRSVEKKSIEKSSEADEGSTMKFSETSNNEVSELSPVKSLEAAAKIDQNRVDLSADSTEDLTLQISNENPIQIDSSNESDEVSSSNDVINPSSTTSPTVQTSSDLPPTSSPPKIIQTSQSTPTKPREASPPPAKVASPFFVNRKTPNSKKKSEPTPGPSTSHPTITIAKNLFPEPSNLQKAAEELRTVKTNEELEEMRVELADQQRNLAQERNKLDRQGTSITESMSRDCKELLKLFGIPYITSPMEAEAQCAFLNMIELTDGTISDDSDIWLFGGQTVYKNFFVQKKIVMEFNYENIEKMFHLDRKKLIQLAMLVGSDYTVGINGIGAVTALEILAAFPPTEEADGATDQYQSLVSSLRKFREWFQGGKQGLAGGKAVLKSKLKNVELFEGFPNLNVAKAYLEPTVDQNAEKFSWGMPDQESLIEYAKAKLGWTRMKTEEILAPVMKRLNEKKQATIKDYFKSQVTKKFFETGKLSKRVQKAVGKMGGEESEGEEEKPKKGRKRKPATKSEGPEVKEKKAKVARGKKKGDAKEESAAGDVVVILSDEDDDEKPATEENPLTQDQDLPQESSALSIEPPKSEEIPTNTEPGTSKSPLKSPPPEPNTKKPRAKPKAKTTKLDPLSDDDDRLFKKEKPKRKRKAKESEPSTSSAADFEDDPPAKKSPRIPETKQVIPQREKDKEEQEKAKQKAIEIFKKSKDSKKKK